MRTYILREPKAVEPQYRKRNPLPNPLHSDPAISATGAVICGQPGTAPPALGGRVLYVGLDVHNDTIAVSLAPSDRPEVRRYGIIGGQHEDVLKLLKKLQTAHPGAALKFCYEAGPRGYPLCRFIRQHGAACLIVAPSRVPRQPGDRVKTDRRDADQLARLFRAGELTGIYVPDPQDEAVRDLIRARYQVSQQQHRARQQLKMFLLRQNIRYTGTKPWTAKHLNFLATVKLPFAEQQFVFQELVNVISDAGQRLERYEKEIASVVASWRRQPVVKALMSLRGVAGLTGATLVAELGDLHRFPSAPQLMSYLGLCPGDKACLDPMRFARSAVGAGRACRDYEDGQRDRAQGHDRGGVEQSAAGPDQPHRAGAPDRVAQSRDRSLLGGADAAASKIQTPDGRGPEEIPGGRRRAGPRTRGVRVGHRPHGPATRGDDRG